MVTKSRTSKSARKNPLPGGVVTAIAPEAFQRILKAAKNPSKAAEAAFEEFHGHKPEEVVTVTSQVHFHSHLAGAGTLEFLTIRTQGGSEVKLKNFKGALLCFNERQTQLFIVGGDQKVPLDLFGIAGKHECEMLGHATNIGYETRKDHLGDEGGEAVYVHKFRTTNENGRHVTVEIAEYPWVTYDVVNEQLAFWGGSYFIRAEGIDL